VLIEPWRTVVRAGSRTEDHQVRAGDPSGGLSGNHSDARFPEAEHLVRVHRSLFRSGASGKAARRGFHPSTAGKEVGGGESVPRIEDYRFGHVVVDGKEQRRDVIVLPDRVVSDWWRAEGHRLALADLDEVIEELPERLVVGTGAYGQLRPEPEALHELRRRGVEVETLPTDKAVGRYSELDPRRTAAALHLTC